MTPVTPANIPYVVNEKIHINTYGPNKYIHQNHHVYIRKCALIRTKI